MLNGSLIERPGTALGKAAMLDGRVPQFWRTVLPTLRLVLVAVVVLDVPVHRAVLRMSLTRRFLIVTGDAPVCADAGI